MVPMVAAHKRATMAFSGAAVFFIGCVMLLDSHTAASTVIPASASVSHAFLSKRSAAPATTFQNFWTPGKNSDDLSLKDVKDLMEKWITYAQERDVDEIVELYDAKVGRLLGTVDTKSSPRRDSRKLIKDYFDHFLGDHEKVVPLFPRFDAKDVQFIDDKTAVYSGYYTFELTPIGGDTKIVNAKFTYIIHRTSQGVKFVLHNSGITPEGVVMKSSSWM